MIETAVAGSNAGEYRVDGNAYRILLQLENAEKRSLNEILDLFVRTPEGELVVLWNLVSSSRGQGPVTIERKDQQRIVSVSANVSGRDLRSVATDIATRLDTIARPIGYDLFVSGSFAEQKKSFHELVLSLALALVLVYAGTGSCLYGVGSTIRIIG